MNQSTAPPLSIKANLRNLDNDDVILLAQQSDSRAMDALEELVRRHQKNVYVTLYHMAPQRTDLQDLTQDVLLRMCRSIKNLRNPKTFKYWLNRIITNLFYDQLRKKPRTLNTISMDASYGGNDDSDAGPRRDIPDTSATPDKLLVNSELDEKIQHAIQDLPEHFRIIIVLREIQGLSYEEIATLTQTNLGTVKSRLARARLKLQETLKPYLKDAPTP